MTKPSIVFAGTPAFAAEHLQALIEAGHSIQAVYTQPDRPAGRKKKLTPSPVKELAAAHGIPVFQPLNFKHNDDIQQLAALAPDLLVVVAYGLILPQAVLDIPRLGAINVHASLLPRWRGAAPIERALEAGDTHTGVGIMMMEAGLDTGPILAEAQLAIGPDTTGDALRTALSQLGCKHLLTCISAIAEGSANATAQTETGVTYAHKLRRDETAIHWSAPALTIHNKVRAFNASNVTMFTAADTRVKLWRTTVSSIVSEAAVGTIISHADKRIHVQCGQGAIALCDLQLPGKRVLGAADILNGNGALFAVGSVLR